MSILILILGLEIGINLCGIKLNTCIESTLLYCEWNWNYFCIFLSSLTSLSLWELLPSHFHSFWILSFLPQTQQILSTSLLDPSHTSNTLQFHSSLFSFTSCSFILQTHFQNFNKNMQKKHTLNSVPFRWVKLKIFYQKPIIEKR